MDLDEAQIVSAEVREAADVVLQLLDVFRETCREGVRRLWPELGEGEVALAFELAMILDQQRCALDAAEPEGSA